MALKISLKPNERVIVGGAVLRNVNKRPIEFLVENEVPLLRERELLTEANANTPCKRIFFVIQLMYVDPIRLDQHRELYDQLIKQVVEAAPSTASFIPTINIFVDEKKYYQALKEARKLIEYENEVIKNAL